MDSIVPAVRPSLIVWPGPLGQLVVGQVAHFSSGPVSASHYVHLTLQRHGVEGESSFRVMYEGDAWTLRLPDHMPMCFESFPGSYQQARRDATVWRVRFYTHNDVMSGDTGHCSETWANPMVGVCVQLVYRSPAGDDVFKVDLGQIVAIDVTAS